jgi:hypothetical protein
MLIPLFKPLIAGYSATKAAITATNVEQVKK